MDLGSAAQCAIANHSTYLRVTERARDESKMQRPWGAVGEDEVDASKPTGDVADTGEVSPGNEQQPVLHPAPTLPGRPPLQRDAMQAVPPPVPAPDPPMTNTTIAVDPEPANSLSLLQLRRIVAEVHRTEPLAYDFEYADMGPHADEIDEWFGYQSWQWVRLSAAQRAFDWHWRTRTRPTGARGRGTTMIMRRGRASCAPPSRASSPTTPRCAPRASGSSST